jgi:hypothetical protein
MTDTQPKQPETASGRERERALAGRVNFSRPRRPLHLSLQPRHAW